MQPTMSDVHVNTPLTNISIAYMQDQDLFVAAQVFPTVPVEKQSDRYYIYNRGDFNRDDMAERAPGAESAGSGYNLDNTPTYFARVWALHKDVPDQIRANSDSVLAPDRDATVYLTNKALIRRERYWANAFFKTGLWTTEYTGVASSASVDATHFLQWDQAASSPIEDIRKGKTAAHLASGFIPNTLTLGQQTWDKLIDHPDIIDRVKYGQTPGKPAVAQRQALAQILELDNVYVGGAIYNTAVEGGTESNAYIAGKHALLSYRPAAPGLMVPSAGYTFAWRGYFGAGADGLRMKSFRMEWLESDRVELELAFDSKLIGVDLGTFYNGAVA